MVEAEYIRYQGSAEAGPSRLPLNTASKQTRPKRRRRDLCITLLTGLLAVSTVSGQSSSPGPRWGQAAALFDDYFVIHGGKTNGDVGGSGYAYSGGVNTAELLLLNLNRSFSTASPPWVSINSSYSSVTSPAVAFHSISPINQGSQLLVFGGDVSSTTSSNLRGNDSAFFLQLNNTGPTAWWQAPASFNQPERRIHHSADTDGDGALWIVGGERDDGSQIMMNELWSLDESASSPSFQQQNEPTGGLVGSTATLLSDGTLLVLGGQTSFGLQTFANVSAYSTTSKTWSTVNTVGANSSSKAIPAPRQGHVAVTLPHQRVLIHGGASLDWSQSMGDMWVLDWSKTPPTWSQIATTSSLAPSARFGHSAAAKGQKVLYAFGYKGSGPADTDLYAFDATSMTSNKAGFWTGGTWISSYTPDAPQTGKKKGNSNSSNSGSTVVSTGDGITTVDSTPTNTGDAFVPPSNTGDSNNNTTQDTKTSAKAGAAIGALLGVGLVAGVGYMLYKKRYPPPDHYRFGDGSDGAAGGLLRASQHYHGADDDPYMLEKGRDYTGIGPGGVASFQQGTRPGGPRIGPSQSDMLPVTMSMANIGHAMEGSGPHLRERLALITGFGRRDATGGRQQRFDMLADEDDFTHDALALEEKREPIEDDEDDYDEDHQYNIMARRMREQSYYGQVEQADLDDEYNRSYLGGDLAGVGAGYSHDYEVSPFEDGERHLIASDVRRSRDEDYNDSRSFVNTIDTADANSRSSHSHGNTNSSKSGQDSSNSTGKNRDGLVSFSDANHGSVSSRRESYAMSPMIKRSPTWWDRFMGQSFLERSASGRLYSGPRAEEPIRDPAAPPALTVIKESPRSANNSDGNPFGDGNMFSPGMNEMGGYVDAYMETHSSSLSSLQSNQTMTSSIMEAQLQNMDVVIQRVGTSSSRRSLSTARSASEDTLSRNTSAHASAGHRHVIAPNETPGSVIFDPNEWNSTQVPHTVEEETEGNGSFEVVPLDANTSADIVEAYTPAPRAARKRSNTNDYAVQISSPAPSYTSGMKRSRTATESSIPHRSALKGGAAKVRNASDAPSLTPSTTKRARQNKQLTAPLTPQSKRTLNVPVQGSVLDRVKAIEQRRNEAGEYILPIPRSPAAMEIGSPGSIYSPEMEKTNMFVPGRGGRPILTRVITAQDYEGIHDTIINTSPAKVKTPVKMMDEHLETGGSNNKMRYSVGLVPKQQLFVANPDGRQASGDSQ